MVNSGIYAIRNIKNNKIYVGSSVNLDGQPRLDLGGRLKYNEGVVCWGFGKHVNKAVSSEPGYINWCLGADFPEDFKNIIRKYL